MPRLLATALTGILAIAMAAPRAEAETASLVTIHTPRGVEQSFILIKPDQPVASVILFAGGHGALLLDSASTMKWGVLNFLVRSRDKFAAQDLMVAVVDAPSDRRYGMNAIFRMSEEHTGDIAAVAAYLKGQARVPVWLVGTSMGTFSAAAGAIAVRSGNIQGLVLTSTITRSKPDWLIAASHRHGVASMHLERITVPTLILSHEHDICHLTPAGDAPKLAKRLRSAKPVEVALITGGYAVVSDPCGPMAEHGYLGVETEAVDRIVAFVKAHSG
jgi:hypothetical protein